MATPGIKEYTLKINGVATSLKEVTTLEDAIKGLDSAVKQANTATATAAKTSTARKVALTDEEKAAKKLADTQRRIAEVNSEANRAQIAANLALREATREATRNIQINEFAEGSIRQMGMALTDLRNEYEELNPAQRASAEIGGELLARIQALDTEYKALRESTGNFRDSVGNYGRAIEGLERLSMDLKDAGEASVGLATSLVGSNRMMNLFGNNTENLTEGLEAFNKIMIIVIGAQSLYQAVTQEGLIADGIAATVSATRTVQLKAQAAAQALATRGTVAATAAQTAFNVVASANPYVLLALGLASVGAALFAFADKTDGAAKSQKAINQLQADYLTLLDQEAGKLATAGDERVRSAERALELLQAQNASITAIRAAEDALFVERLRNNARLRGFYSQELADLETNRKKVEDLAETLRRLNREKAAGAEKTYIDIEGRLDTRSLTARGIDEAIEAVQGQIDNLGKSVSVAVELTAEAAEIEQAGRVAVAERIQQDREAAKGRLSIERDAIRAGEDLRLQALESETARRMAETALTYDRQIEDLKNTLAQEQNLTTTARRELNAQIVQLDVLKGIELTKIQEEITARELETLRAAEDSRTALISGEMERRTAQINIAYDRQVTDLFTRLEREKDLTESQQAAITQMIVDAEINRGKELDAITGENMQRNSELQIRAARTTLDEIRKAAENGRAEGRIIDVEATKADLAAVFSALSGYVLEVQEYQNRLKALFEANTAGMDQNSIEYREALQTFVEAMNATNAELVAAAKEQENITKESTKIQSEYYKQLFEAVASYARLGADAVTAVTDAATVGLQFTIESLNAELDVIAEKYDEAQRQREQSVENVEALEERLQKATGGTADALRAQLQDSMAARKEAELEEQRLAKEKEKREAEIAKKEKQQRRVDLIAGIAAGIANTAEGVTKMLALPWPLNLLMAAFVGGAGAVQVGIMTEQLTKLEDGGLIKGPSHSQGGARIEGTNIEVEGGEMVVNKRSTAANMGLLTAINDAAGPLALSDVVGASVSAPESVQAQDNRILEAIEAINLRPVVSVVDINDAQSNLTEVQDLSGFDS